MTKINGVIVPSITIFNHDFSLNREANSYLFRHQLLNGATSIFLFGSTGEGLFYHDRIDTKTELINLAYETIKEEIPIICGAFGNSEEIVINQIDKLGKAFSNLGFVIAPPFERKMSSKDLVGFMESILGSVAVSNKIILYNNPRNFANNELELNHVKNLLNNPNLLGIKDTSEGFRETKKFLELLSEDFCVFCGEELNYSKFLMDIPSNLVENSGVVPSISNISNICGQMIDALKINEIDILPNLQDKLNEIDKKIYDNQSYKGNEQRGLKYALYSIYGDRMSSTKKDVMNLTPAVKQLLQSSREKEISKAIVELIKSGYIRVL
ncbi:MAG: hypothetical protein GF383_14040 [Candidatus Lokiarchaeota archaeon]|nr:hypothetical protein [Candidatus Lokiarchaeota archaeon]MBD3342460.1 hypothetical protein [Candidatus Lokiarchaeota archaeon]